MEMYIIPPKKIIIFFLFIISVNVLSSENKELSDEERAWLLENNEILFVSQSNYPPFEFLDNEHNSTGMSIELIRWIATEFGFKARFKAMSFKEAQEAVLNGEADAITSLFYSGKRDELFDFTPTTWEVPALIFIKSERPDIKTLKDLNGKRVAMQRGDYAAEFLEQEGIDYSLIPSDTFEEAVNYVISGKADAVIGDKQIVLYHLFNNQVLDKVKSIDTALYIGQNSIAVKDRSQILRSILVKGLKQARDKGIIMKIDQKWMGTQYSRKSHWLEEYLFLVLIGLGSLAVLIVLIALWNFQLRKTVSRRTRELHISQAHLRSLFNSIPDLLWLKDPEGKILNCNHRYEELLDMKEKEIIGKSDYDFFDKTMADEYSKHDRRAIEKGRSFNETSLLYKNDGHIEQVEIIKTALYDENRNLVGTLGIAHDLTERIETGKKLEENEAFLDTILESIPNMLFVKDAKDLTFLRFNKASEELLGHSKEELLGKNDYDFFPKKEADFFTMNDRKALESTKPVDIPEESVRTKSGERKILHTQKISIPDSQGNARYLLGISEDITQQKRIEELLQIQRDLGVSLGAVSSLEHALSLCLDAVMQVSGIDCGGIYKVDSMQETISLVEQKNMPEEILDKVSFYKKDSEQYQLVMKGKPIYSTHPKILASLNNDHQNQNSKLKALCIYPVFYIGKVVAVMNVASLHDEEFNAFTKNSLETIATQMAETLARLYSDQALQNSQQNFQTLFDNINDFLFIIGEEGKLLHWNPIVEKRLGYNPDELEKMTVLDLHPVERRDEAQSIVAQMLQGKRKSCPIPLYSKNTDIIPVETMVTKGLWNGKPAIFGISRDISEMKRNQERIQKSLEEKEILMKEIHHRVKNNLQVISSLLSLQSETTTDPSALAAFHEAENKVRSMSLVHEILYKSDRLDRIQLQTYLDNLVENLRVLYMEKDFNIEVNTEGIEIQLEQAVSCGLIFTELISNSLKHAFPDQSKGNIKITVVLLDDGTLKAVVSDDGCGLSQDMIPDELTSLGIRLVTDLVEGQLEGKWHVDGHDGTSWTITWKGV